MPSDQRQHAIALAKRTLEAEGYVVLRAKSYHQAQERQRVAEALRDAAERERESTRTWALKAFDSQRESWDRTTYLYGLAAKHGATDEELHHVRFDWPTTEGATRPERVAELNPRNDARGES